MPLFVGPSGNGIVAVGDGSLSDLETLIPDPDFRSAGSPNAGAGSVGYHLDEMSPGCATQLRLEINKYLETAGEPDVSVATGSHVATAGEVTANEITIDTGLTTAVALDTLIVQYSRAGTGVAGGTVTDNADGTFTITESGGLDITAGDTIDWYARIA